MTASRLLRRRQLHIDLDARNAVHRLGRGAHFADERTRIVLIEHELDVDFGVFVDVDLLHLLGLNHILTGTRMLDLLECGAYAGEQGLAIY